MAIFKEFEEDGVKVVLGRYEGEEYQQDFSLLDEEWQAKIADFPLKRQKEILMTRRILYQILPDYQLFYRENGEPYVVPENRYISISHSEGWGAVAVSCQKIGIDLEKNQEKILKLKHRFLHNTEYAWVENERESDYLWAIWTIKEALYKIHPAKYYSFRERYEVARFDYDSPKNIQCSIINDDESRDLFRGRLYRIEGGVLAVVRNKSLYL